MRAILDEKQWEKELDDQDSKIVPDQLSVAPLGKAKSFAQPEQVVAPVEVAPSAPAPDSSLEPGETSAWADSPYNQ
jgi:hypothetical protein